jgi:O-antigen/teichoic acid export membrane protein
VTRSAKEAPVARSLEVPEPPVGRVRALVTSQLSIPLVRNAYSLVGSTIVNSALGVVFWIVAARKFSTATYGTDEALISAMTFVSVLAQLNLNNGFNRFVPTAGRNTLRLVRAGYAAAVALTMVAAVVFVLGDHVWAAKLAFLGAHPLEATWFIVATMIWTIFVLEDAVLIGLGEAQWVLVENAIFGVLKIIALVIIATEISRFGIFLAWTLPLILLVIPVNLFLFRRAIPQRSTHEPLEQLDARVIARFVGPDFAASMVRTATTSLTPIIVLSIAGAKASAYIFTALTFSYTLYLLTLNVGASLITEASRAPERIVEYTRKAVRHCLAIVVPIAIVLVAGGHLVLSVFGETYAEHGTIPLQLIALSAIPDVVIASYVSVARVRRRMQTVVLTITSTSTVLLVLTVVLLKAMGINGVGLAWLIAQSATATVLLSTTFRWLWLPSAHARQVHDVETLSN